MLSLHSVTLEKSFSKLTQIKKPYIVFDDHREAPVGFGVKVSLTKKPL